MIAFCFGDAASFYVSSVVSLLCAAGSVLFNGLLIILIPKNSSLSKNVQIMINCLAVSLVAYSLSDLFRSIYVLHEYTWNAPMRINVSSVLCWVCTYFGSLSGLSQSVSIVAIAIERIFSTLRYKTVNEDSKVIAVVLLVALGIINVAVLLTIQYDNNCMVLSRVQELNETVSEVFQPGIQILILLEFASFVAFGFVGWRSHILLNEYFANQAQLTLTQRIHLDHILKGSKILLCVSGSNICTYVIGIGSLALGAGLQSTNFIQCYHVALETLLIRGIGHVNGIVIPSLFFYHDYRIRKYLKKMLLMKATNQIHPEINEMVEHPTDEANRRIETLADQWNQAFDSKQKIYSSM